MLLFFGKLEARKKFDGELRSVVILAQEKIGDAILLTPLFKMLRRTLPRVKISVVVFSPIASFFERDPNVDVVYRVKENYLAYFRTILKQKFDLLFCPKDHPSFTFLYQSRLIPARHRVGIYHPYHEGYFHHQIRLDFHQHVIEKNCALLAYLGISYSPADCRPYLPEEEVSPAVRDFVSQISGKFVVGINLCAGEKDREWSLSRWEEFLRQMKQPTVVFSTPDRESDKRRLEESFPFVLKSPQTGSIYEAGQIIRHLKLLVSPDTSLIHVASCYDTPVVGLYRSFSIHLDRFYPYLVPNRIIVSPTHRIEDIPVEQVVQAVEEMLDGDFR